MYSFQNKIPIYYINKSNTTNTDDKYHEISDSESSVEFEYQEEDTIDLLVMYLCSFVSFIIPLVGFFYIFCFTFCRRSYYGPRKLKALKVLWLSTILNIIAYIIIILIKTHKIKLK